MSNKALFRVKQISEDEFMGEVIDFVPDQGDLEFTPLLAKGFKARDTCGDGTDEYEHIEPLVTWQDFPVSYYINSIPMSLQKGIDEAFTAINKFAGKRMFEKTVTQGNAKIIISIMRIDQAGATLARSQWFYSSRRKEITRATITFDSSENWSYLQNESCGANGNVFDIANVAMHEVGHLVGLGHAPTDKLQTMYATTGPGQTLGRTFGNGDLKGFKKAYDIEDPVPEENKPPVAENISIQIENNQEVMIELKAKDPEGSDLLYTIKSNPKGRLVQSESDTFFYSPPEEPISSDSFTYTAKDNRGLESNVATVSISLSEANRPPISENLLVETVRDTPITIALEATDPEGDPITYIILEDPSQGELMENAKGDRVQYTPIQGFTGIDKFVYSAIDSHQNQGAPANVTIVVKTPDSPPDPPNPPANHKLSQQTLLQMKNLWMIYEQFDKAGMEEQAEEALQKYHNFVQEALVELHS